MVLFCSWGGDGSLMVFLSASLICWTFIGHFLNLLLVYVTLLVQVCLSFSFQEAMLSKIIEKNPGKKQKKLYL